MSFEEKFPSLKDKVGCFANRDCEWGNCGHQHVDIKHVEKHCLDKQTVKKVFERLKKYHFTDEIGNPLELCADLDDLKLENEE